MLDSIKTVANFISDSNFMIFLKKMYIQLKPESRLCQKGSEIDCFQSQCKNTPLYFVKIDTFGIIKYISLVIV